MLSLALMLGLFKHFGMIDKSRFHIWAFTWEIVVPSGADLYRKKAKSETEDVRARAADRGEHVQCYATKRSRICNHRMTTSKCEQYIA